MPVVKGKVLEKGWGKTAWRFHKLVISGERERGRGKWFLPMPRQVHADTPREIIYVDCEFYHKQEWKGNE